MSFYPADEELPPLGALCIDYTDDIHRPPGDVIMPTTYQFPVIWQKVDGASLWAVVNSSEFSNEYLQSYIDACKILESKGCIGIITSCGFLAQTQKKIAASINIPIASSSLIQIPFVLTIISPQKKIGVLTFDATELGVAHFNGVGVTKDMLERVVVAGCKKNGALHRIIADGDPYIAAELEDELVSLATSLLNENPTIGAFVLECTNMPPCSKAIQNATGLPVFDGVTMVDWFYSGLKRKSLPEDANKESGLRRRLRGDKEKR